MASTIEVRAARGSDMESVAALVNHFIETTTFNFRTHPQTAGQWRADFEAARERYPWLVAHEDGRVVGLAYAGPWKARDAYDWCAESTVYIADGQHRRGIGRLLYRQLLGILDAQGYRSVLGVVGLPNPASAALHEAFGFVHTGTLRRVGFKHGRWCDIGFWQRLTGDPDQPPGDILPVAGFLP